MPIIKNSVLLSFVLLVSVLLYYGNAGADITSGKYGVNQVFDCQRNPAFPQAGVSFTASNFKKPYRDTGSQYEMVSGEYIQFFYIGGTCSSGDVGIKRYDSSGNLMETISASGLIYGIENIGFLYVSSSGGYGTFVSNSAGYDYGESLTYTTISGSAADCASLSVYAASSSPISSTIVPSVIPPVIPGPPLPIVITAEVSNITDSEALSGGEVIYPEGCTALLVGRGVAWDTVSPPTYPQDASTFDGWESGEYTSGLTNLLPQTKYYVRAYVMYKQNNVVYTRYSEYIYSFTTEALPGDVNGDKILDLKDAILALKVVAGIAGNTAINLFADVNGDGKIGMEEAVYVLQNVGIEG